MGQSESGEEALGAGLWRCRWELWGGQNLVRKLSGQGYGYVGESYGAIRIWWGSSRGRVMEMSVRVMGRSESGEEALGAGLWICRWELWGDQNLVRKLSERGYGYVGESYGAVRVVLRSC